ncbi:MAG: beta-ketoacyl synthase N-terminal-like domain-containing protein, partial [Chitinophagaceae bacterium]
TSITIRDTVMQMMVISATVFCNEIMIAQCDMNIMIEKKELEVFIVADSIISPLGNSTSENFIAIKNGQSGIKKHNDMSISLAPFYASLFEPGKIFLQNNVTGFTKFEEMLIAAISNTIEQTSIDIKSEKLILVISSTKGNIVLLETEPYNLELEKRIALHSSANKVATHFNLFHTPVVISNACISGIAAILTGKRLLDAGKYDHAIVVGADVISKFILSGFESFQAVSDEPCKPFDENRNGITLGEAAASVLLSVFPNDGMKIKVMGGSVSNDANHISAPSRTGEELAIAIDKAIIESGISANEIDFISAHGTATMYNDEMESKALHLAGLENSPVNSLKGFFGHTLGAAGLVESIISIRSMKENTLIPTAGYERSGDDTKLNIYKTVLTKELKNCLKTASGFGGCNAAIIFSKIEK